LKYVYRYIFNVVNIICRNFQMTIIPEFIMYILSDLHKMSLHYHKCFKISEKRTKGQTMMYNVQHRKLIIYIEKFEDTKGRFFSGVRVTRSLVLCVCFIDHCLSFCTFSFDHCVVCSSIYGFWLPPFGIVNSSSSKDKQFLFQ
jgi:hypothetical protein